MIAPGNKEILDRALELEPGSQLYVACSSDNERDVLYYDLKRQRSYLIKEKLGKYEQVIIDRNHLNLHPNVTLSKRNMLSIYIMKADGSKESIS